MGVQKMLETIEGARFPTNQKLNILKSAAFSYWRQGLNIVLVKNKKPLSEWKQWQSQRQTEADFEALPWNEADGFALIGGSKLDNGLYIAAVDFDIKNVSEEARERGLKVLKRLPITQIERTISNGQHWIYYTHKKPSTITAYHNDCAVELLGENKLIIMAPSEGYRRLNDNTPTVVQDIEELFLKALGKERLAKPRKQNMFWFNRQDLAAKPYRGKHPLCIQKLLRGVNEGERNEACIRLCSYFANFRMIDPNKTWKLILQWNKRNDPPLNAKELREVFESALKGGYVFGCSDSLLSNYCSGKPECPLGAANLEPLEIIEHELEKQRVIKLHPLIDYHPETGFAIGTLLKASGQTLLFLKEKPFILRFDNCLLEEMFSHPVSVMKPRWAFLEETWSENLLRLAKEHYKKGKIEFPSENEAFEKVLEKLRYYWYHSDSRYYTLVACWIIGSYFHPIFTFYPVLTPQGQRETGKSTLLELLRRMCWNPTGREVALREADLFRTIQDSRVTYIADITRLNPKTKTYTDVIDIYETGTERGGKVRRIDQNTEKPIEYQTYGPKSIATRYELPFTAKCIRIITEKAPDPVYSKRRAQLDFDPEWAKIVNALLRAAIKYWLKIAEAYPNIEQTDKLRGRVFNYWAPLLAVCKVFASQHYNELLKLAEEMAETQEKGDRLSEVEDAILVVLLEYDVSTIYILLKELTEKVQNIVPWIKDWHVVKSALDNLGIVKKRLETRKGVSYQIDIKKAKQKAKARGIGEEPLEEKAASSENVFAEEAKVQLDDLKAVYWSDRFYERYECCICGYQKLTCWQAETYKGNKHWICEDCKQEWEKRRNNVD
jgi:hypothetical protein